MITTAITFSPTGGTAEITDLLAKAIGNHTTTIDLTSNTLNETMLSEEVLALIAVPSFGGRVPSLAVERLKLIHGNGAKAVLVVVYGNRAYEDTLIELYDAAVECGFSVIAGVSAVAKHSIATQIAADRPDASDVEALNDFGKRIAAKVMLGNVEPFFIPGNRPYREVGAMPVPKTGKQCNRCGKCALLCPSGAIDTIDHRKIDKTLCISCMRCVSICPVSAKYLPKLVRIIVNQKLKNLCATRKDPELFI